MKRLWAMLLVLGSELVADCCPKECPAPVCNPCCETVNPYVFDPFKLECDHHSWVKGEVLVLLASPQSAGYAQKAESKIDSATATRTAVTVETLNTKFDWDPGCRVALGYKFHDRMDMVAQFTYIHGHGSDSATATTNTNVNADNTEIFPFNGFGSLALGVSSLFNSNLYIGDLELGRHFFTTCWLDLRPFIGLRGFYYHQKQTFFNTQENIFFIAIPTITDTITRILDFRKGAGIRLGLDTLWGLKYGISVYANWAASILGIWSKTINDRKPLSPAPPETTIIVTETPFGALSGISELSLGFQYNAYFSCNRYHLGINAGYEFISFLNDAQFFLYGASSFIRYQGLSAGLRFDY